MILQNEHVVAIAAWAGRFPYETWLLPRRHESRYERLTDAELTDLAAAMRTILRRLADVAGDPAYNLMLHTAPAAESTPLSLALGNPAADDRHRRLRTGHRQLPEPAAAGGSGGTIEKQQINRRGHEEHKEKQRLR